MFCCAHGYHYGSTVCGEVILPVKVYRPTHDIGLIDVAPPVHGFENFIGVYVLRGEKVALIDVGPSTSRGNLVSGLGQLGISLADICYILVTHIHLDHVGGLGEALQQMPNAKVVVHERGQPHLADPVKLWESTRQTLGELAFKYGPPQPVPEERMIIAKEGMTVDLGDMKIEVLLTPGHASHHLSFLDRQQGRLFVGEAAGVYSQGIDLVRPATPVPFHLGQALASLDKLIKVNPSIAYYAHFGYTTRPLDKLRHYKQRLILWGRIIGNRSGDEAGWQDIYNEIKEKDRALERLKQLAPGQYQRELDFVRNSIMGYIEYFKRYGTEP